MAVVCTAGRGSVANLDYVAFNNPDLEPLGIRMQKSAYIQRPRFVIHESAERHGLLITPKNGDGFGMCVRIWLLFRLEAGPNRSATVSVMTYH